jgi:hypothetical protein
MTYSTGLVAEEIGDQTFKLFASRQQGAAERVFAASGAIAPPYSIADHVLLDGSPVFHPGSYSGGEDQGGEPWSMLPPANNHYDFVWLGYQLWNERDDALLHETVYGLSLLDRMERAFEAPNFDAATGLVTAAWKRRLVGFIFTDSVADLYS